MSRHWRAPKNKTFAWVRWCAAGQCARLSARI